MCRLSAIRGPLDLLRFQHGVGQGLLLGPLQAQALGRCLLAGRVVVPVHHQPVAERRGHHVKPFLWPGLRVQRVQLLKIGGLLLVHHLAKPLEYPAGPQGGLFGQQAVGGVGQHPLKVHELAGFVAHATQHLQAVERGPKDGLE